MKIFKQPDKKMPIFVLNRKNEKKDILLIINKFLLN